MGKMGWFIIAEVACGMWQLGHERELQPHLTAAHNDYYCSAD